MGVYNFKFFDSPQDPAPNDGIYYYRLTAAELETMSQIWPEFARDFVLRHPTAPNNGFFYAHPSSISDFERGLLMDMNMLNVEPFDISNQPAYYGG